MIATCRIDVGCKFVLSLNYLNNEGFVKVVVPGTGLSAVLFLPLFLIFKYLKSLMLYGVHNRQIADARLSPQRQLNTSTEKGTCRKSCRITFNILKFIGGKNGIH